MTPLQTELANSSYAGLTNAQAAAAVNAKTAMQPVALNAVKLILYQDATPSAMLRIAAAAAVPDATSGVPGLQGAAQQAAAYLNDPHMATIDFTNLVVQSGMALLVSGGILSQTLVNQVEALAVVPWWQSVGLTRPVTTIDVKSARSGI